MLQRDLRADPDQSDTMGGILAKPDPGQSAPIIVFEHCIAMNL